MRELTKSRTYEIKEKVIDFIQVYKFIDKVNHDGIEKLKSQNDSQKNNFQENLLLNYYARGLWV